MSVFVYYSGLVLHIFEADKARLWWIVVTKVLIYVLISDVIAAGEGFSMSKAADLHIILEGFSVLVPMPHRLKCWIYDL